VVTIGNGAALMNLSGHPVRNDSSSRVTSNRGGNGDVFTRSSNEAPPFYCPIPGVMPRGSGQCSRIDRDYHIDERVEMAAESISYDIYYNAKQNGTELEKEYIHSKVIHGYLTGADMTLSDVAERVENADYRDPIDVASLCGVLMSGSTACDAISAQERAREGPYFDAVQTAVSV